MKNILILIALLFFNARHSVSAKSYDLLIDEAKDKSFLLKQAIQNIDNSKFQYFNFEESFRFELTNSLTAYQNLLESSSSFNASNINQYSYKLGISKSFYYGIIMSFETSSNITDRSNWSSLLLGSNDVKVYEGENSLSLSFDLSKNLFGFKNKLESEKYLERVNLSHLELSDTEQKLAKELLKNFLTLKFQKAQKLLYNESLEKNLEQHKLVKSKVRDGLLEKTDLIQSKINLENQKEIISKFDIQFMKFKLGIEKSLGFDINESMIPNLDLLSLINNLEKEKENIFQDFNNIEHIEIQKIKKKVEIEKINNKILKRNNLPELSLALTYATNNYGDSFVDAWSKSFDLSSNEKTISLDFSFPLSREIERMKTQNSNNKVKLSEFELNKKIFENKKDIEILIKTQKSLYESIKITSKKVRLYEELLNKKKNLFKLGKLEFESLIQTETAMLETKKSLVNDIKDFQINKIDLLSSSGKKITKDDLLKYLQ